MTTLITFKKSTIEDAVAQFLEYGVNSEPVDRYDFAYLLHQALEHSASDNIQMSLEDFAKIKKYIQ
jgi:hypothetical protein